MGAGPRNPCWSSWFARRDAPQMASLKGSGDRRVRELQPSLALFSEALAFTRQNFELFESLLREHGWDVDNPLLGFGPWRCDWDSPGSSKQA